MYKIDISNDVAQMFGIYTDYGYFYFNLYWIDFDEGGWFLDIKDLNKKNLVTGIPLVCNINLTKQFKHLVPFDLAVVSESNLNPGRYELSIMNLVFQ